MKYSDPVYSNFEITSPLALELIQSNTFQRLKGISQFGIPNPYYHLPNFSRYEHSIGVYILLQRLGANEEEQIAGLLHDISHTAFSHLVDWVIGDSIKEDFQDKRHLEVLQHPEIATILKKYGLTADGMADYSQFGLLERDLPELCADRIDYSLREAPKEIIEKCLPHFIVRDGSISFNDVESALTYASYFLDRQMNHWAGYETITRYVLFSDMLKLALQHEIIVVEDFYQTDNFVISKIKRSADEQCLLVLALLEKSDLSFLPRSSQVTHKKFRYIDPLVLEKGECFRLSQIDAPFATMLETCKSTNAKGIYAGFMNCFVSK